ncbi:MAG: type II toxin-antitoxin system HicA family toxin [Cyclobacteriaceae bacterium]
MGRLRVFSGPELCKLLAEHGFRVVRQKGSHIILQRRIENSTITVPVPNHKEIKVGTLLSIIRQSHVSRHHFEN